MMCKTMIDGSQIPVMGIGAWQLVGRECEDTTRFAYHIGYRHFDLAESPECHKAAASGLSAFPRYSYYLTSKISHSRFRRGGISRRVEEVLALLKTDYLDLLLLQWPNEKGSISETFDDLMTLMGDSKIRSLGVCNYNAQDLEDARRIAEFPIVNNQIELHRYFYEERLLNYCNLHEVDISVYCTAAWQIILDDLILRIIAEVKNATASQVFLRWLIQKGHIVIPESISKDQLLENLTALDIELSSDEMAEIDSVVRNSAYNRDAFISGVHDSSVMSGTQ
jgi:diketogulonate reductase-like aldo/keto reductase